MEGGNLEGGQPQSLMFVCHYSQAVLVFCTSSAIDVTFNAGTIGPKNTRDH